MRFDAPSTGSGQCSPCPLSRPGPRTIQEVGGEDRAAAQEFATIGTDELIFNPTLDDPDELLRLADVVL